MIGQDIRLCPSIQKRLEKIKNESRNNSACFAGDAICQVKNSREEQYVVDLALKTCSCRSWELSGIPCAHAIAAIAFIGKSTEDFVHQYYTKDYFMKAYTPIIYPINGPNNWPVTRKPAFLAPPKLKLPGRPKKVRRKEPGEKNTTKNGRQKMSRERVGSGKCSKCGVSGHNKRRCSNNAVDGPNNNDNSNDINSHRAIKEQSVLVNAYLDLSNVNKCGICGAFGHNRRTCKGSKITSEKAQQVDQAQEVATQGSQFSRENMQGNDAPRRTFKCSICGQTRHNRLNCPNASKDTMASFQNYLKS